MAAHFGTKAALWPVRVNGILKRLSQLEKGWRKKMSYDCRLVDPVTKETLEASSNHEITGGNYCIGGTDEMWLTVTYNYCGHFRRVMPPEGLRGLDGMMAADSIPVLENGIALLGNDVDDNYWEPTEGNAKKALYGLLASAKLRPDGVWEIS